MNGLKISDLNSLLLEGGLSGDPVSGTTESGTSFCTFSVVSHRVFNGEDGEPKQESGKFPVQTFGKLADVCAEYLKKGRGVRIVGRIRQVGAEGPAPAFIILAEHVEFKPVRNKATT